MSPTVPPTSVITTSTSSVGEAADAALDLVGDVRDDLHRLAEVVAAPLGGEHGLVDRCPWWRSSCGSAFSSMKRS